MIEVLYSNEKPLETEQKRAFAKEAERILEEVLGTPPGRMRLAFQHLPPEDSLGLLEKPETTVNRAPRL
jgi:hypothetical protein